MILLTYGTKINITPTTTNIYNNLNLSNNPLYGGNNVCKRVLFSFTPISTLGGRYYYVIDLVSYVLGLLGSSSTHFVVRIHLWSESGDFGNTVDIVENMTYLIYISTFGGGKSRFYQIVNSSTSSSLSYISGTQVYYSGSPNSAGGSVKYCCIENISGY